MRRFDNLVNLFFSYYSADRQKHFLAPQALGAQKKQGLSHGVAAQSALLPLRNPSNASFNNSRNLIHSTHNRSKITPHCDRMDRKSKAEPSVQR